ncbi:MAG: lipopolysaccharide biosynthesis protein [Prevotellaceae bacterium]|nr:lipopolysaccharide biosynthesis protein [Prevotellaceae bacterium]
MDNLKEKTAKGLLWGALNSGTMQVLNLVFGIFLARMLSPHDYGIVGVLTIFTLIAGNLQSSGFTQGLTNIKQPTANDYNSVFWFNISVSIVCYIILFFCAPLIAWFFHSDELIPLSRFVFLGFLISSFGITRNAIMFKQIMARERAITGFISLLISGACGIVLAYNGFAYWSLAVQSVMFSLIQNICRYYYTRDIWRPSLHIDMSPVKRMFPFSVKVLVTSIINTINNNVLTFIFGNLFPMKTVGNFSQAMKWDTMAYTTISGTIEQVAQPILVEISDDKNRELRVFRKMMRFTAFLVFPCLFGLSLVAEEFILVTISSKWVDSVPLLQILCIGGAFMPFYTMYQHLVISAGRSDIYMWCNIGQIILQIAIIIAFHSFGIVTMVIAYTAFTIAWLGIWHIFAKRLIGIRYRDLFKDIAPFMLASAGVMIITHYLTTLLSNNIIPYIASPYILLPLRIVIAAALYYAVMKVARVKIMDECISYVKRKR